MGDSDEKARYDRAEGGDTPRQAHHFEGLSIGKRGVEKDSPDEPENQRGPCGCSERRERDGHENLQPSRSHLQPSRRPIGGAGINELPDGSDFAFGVQDECQDNARDGNQESWDDPVEESRRGGRHFLEDVSRAGEHVGQLCRERGCRRFRRR